MLGPMERCLTCEKQFNFNELKGERFNPGARLDVIFVDDSKAAEGAVDGGGPTREYLRLLLKAVQQSSIFEGPENS